MTEIHGQSASVTQRNLDDSLQRKAGKWRSQRNENSKTVLFATLSTRRESLAGLALGLYEGRVRPSLIDSNSP